MPLPRLNELSDPVLRYALIRIRVWHLPNFTTEDGQASYGKHLEKLVACADKLLLAGMAAHPYPPMYDNAASPVYERYSWLKSEGYRHLAAYLDEAGSLEALASFGLLAIAQRDAVSASAFLSDLEKLPYVEKLATVKRQRTYSGKRGATGRDKKYEPMRQQTRELAARLIAEGESKAQVINILLKRKPGTSSDADYYSKTYLYKLLEDIFRLDRSPET